MNDEFREKLYRAWQEYIDYYVVQNDHLKEALWRSFVGAVLTKKGYGYMETSEKNSLRFHCFFIQPSGTGKSESTKRHHRLLEYLEVPSYRTLQSNEANLTGTVDKDGEEHAEVKEGNLANYYAFHWDEGKTLLEGGQYSEKTTDFLQMAMDENGVSPYDGITPGGMVHKGMRDGEVEYHTSATIIAGSYMFSKFGEVMLHGGFLQRMFLSYKQFNASEKRDIRIGVNALKQKSSPERIKKVKQAMQELVDEIPDVKEFDSKEGEMRLADDAPYDDGTINFEEDAINKQSMELEELHDEYVNSQFVGEKQSALETYFNRCHKIVDKVAAQEAILHGRDKVIYEDIRKGLEMAENHLQSALQVLDRINRGQTSDPVDKRTEKLRKIIRRQGGEARKQDILQELKKQKNKGQWDLAFKRSKQFINECISQGKIETGKNEVGTEVLVVSQD